MAKTLKQLKRENELRVLEAAFRYGMQKGGITRRILSTLGATSSCYVHSDVPDFVSKEPIKTASGEAIIIGIEHLLVDHLSEKSIKEKAPLSHSSQLEKAANELLEKGRIATADEHDVPPEIIKQLAEIVGEMIVRTTESPYSAYHSAFTYSFTKHLDRVKQYKNNLKDIARYNERVVMVFLIEIRSEFSKYSIAQKGSSRRLRPGDFFITSEIASLLERAHNIVDYIILVGQRALSGNEPNIVAIPSSSVRRSLSNQGFPIVEYAGIDSYLPAFFSETKDGKITADVEPGKEEFRIVINHEYKMASDQDLTPYLFASLRDAWMARKEGKAYIMDLRVARAMYCLGDNITGWVLLNNGTLFPRLTNLRQQTIFERDEEFKKLWDIGSEDVLGDNA